MTDTTDRDAAPAAAEGADYWGYRGVYLPESRIPDEPVALFRYSDHAARWARESYPGRHVLRANKAARPAPPAAPRAGDEEADAIRTLLDAALGAIHGAWWAQAERCIDEAKKRLSARDAARGEG